MLKLFLLFFIQAFLKPFEALIKTFVNVLLSYIKSCYFCKYMFTYRKLLKYILSLIEFQK